MTTDRYHLMLVPEPFGRYYHHREHRESIPPRDKTYAPGTFTFLSTNCSDYVLSTLSDAHIAQNRRITCLHTRDFFGVVLRVVRSIFQHSAH